MKRILLAFTAAVAATAAYCEDFSIPVDSDFQDSDITWQGDAAGKGYLFVWDIRVGDDYVYLCGAGKFTDPSTQQITRQVLRKSFVEYNGKKVLKDISFFAKVPFNADLRSAKATCRATTVPANAANGDFTLKTAGGSFRL